MLMSLLSGCKNKNHDDQIVLISAGETTITVADFNKALEISKTAYAHNVLRNPDSYRQIKSRLLKQMAEEVVLLKIAGEKQITVTDEEVEDAVKSVQSDYPEGEFKEALLESAISYSIWKDRIRRRLLLEKVVKEQWGKDIEITPEEMTEYYEQNYAGKELNEDEINDPEIIYSRLIKRLKREKTEASYQKWIEEKKDYYSIEVNKKVWEKIIGSEGQGKKD
jgi:FKBP-type peptidyl-prolyl cis-trans isomerase (trigger factor)